MIQATVIKTQALRLYAQQELYGERLREMKVSSRPTRQTRGDSISISPQAKELSKANIESATRPPEITYGNPKAQNESMHESRFIPATVG